MKFTITVTEFRPLCRNTLRGFAKVHVDELKLTLHDLSVHQHDNGKRWVSLPSRPMVDRDGIAKRRPDGKIEYATLFSFDNRETTDAFSAAAVKALVEFDADAFDGEVV